MAVKTEGLKFKYSLYSALAFFLVANPVTFRFVNSILNGVAVNGCPTAFGFMLHTLVFFVVVYGLMSLPKDQD
jgi:glucan phosphoethanolaminetransferase (alkaline phosphatase superfamily)